MFTKLTKHLSGMQLIAGGFFLIILIGTFLLMLPCAAKSGECTPFLTALFTAASATCVTGLIVVDTFSHWTLFGQLVLLLLIQIGGMGVVTFAVVIASAAGQRISLKQRGLMQDAISAPQIGGILRFTGFIVTLTAVFELTGAALLLGCDLVSKLLALPVNTITALTGIPVVVIVVLRNRSFF